MKNIKEEERRKSIIEFIESNKNKRTKIAFLFDDKKTGEKDIKIYLGEMLKVFEEETKQKMIEEFKKLIKNWSHTCEGIYGDISHRRHSFKVSLGDIRKLYGKLEELKKQVGN